MAPSGICPGSCNNSYRKARQLYEAAIAEYDPASDQERPEPPDIQPWPGDPVWCRKCQGRIRRELAELDDLAAFLAVTLPALTGPLDAGRVTGTPVAPSPSPHADDLNELLTILLDWENAYRGLREWPSPPRRDFLADVLTTCIAWLGHHLDGILATDFATEFGEEILMWHREMASKAKAGSGVHRKPARCPRCQLMLLTWREGDDYVACGNPDCGRLLSLDEYEHHAAVLAAA